MTDVLQPRGRTEDPNVAGGMIVEWDVPIPADDGIVLRADVFRPGAVGAYPVILSYGPYGKGLSFQEAYPNQWEIMLAEHPEVGEGSSGRYQAWEVVDPEKWVPDGYVCVRVDSRGAGRSPGFLDPKCAREDDDLYQCIEWAAAQPWSSGRVGLLGISYYAMNQWKVAAMRPPHLAAICPWEGASDAYRELTRHGGILSTMPGNWFDKQLMDLGVQHGVGDRGAVNPVTGETVAGPETLSEEELAANRATYAQDIRANPLMSDWHRERTGDLKRIEVPLLSAGNWGGQGLHLRGNVEGYAQAGSRQKWLEMHGLEHWTHFYTDYGVRLQKRFFGHFLKDEDTGWESQPPVLLQVRHVDGTFTERGEDAWPVPRTRWTRLYLDPAGEALRAEAPAAGAEVSFEASGEGVTFWTPPLEHETEVTGPAAAKLFVSSSTEDADLFLIIRVFAPDGREALFRGAIDPNTPVAQGWLRASHRRVDPERSTPYRPWHPHAAREPLAPGEPYELDVEIWPTSVVIPAGHRIALTVQGRDYEHGLRESARLTTFKNEMKGCGPFLHDDAGDRPADVFAGTTTLRCGGEHPAFLLLPVVPPAAG